ncbi:hypothetical protein MRX96_005395 [Rhipicephalus microplus]
MFIPVNEQVLVHCVASLYLFQSGFQLLDLTFALCCLMTLVYRHVQQLVEQVPALWFHYAFQNSTQFQAVCVVFGVLHLEDESLAFPNVVVQVV